MNQFQRWAFDDGRWSGGGGWERELSGNQIVCSPSSDARPNLLIQNWIVATGPTQLACITSALGHIVQIPAISSSCLYATMSSSLPLNHHQHHHHYY